MTKEPMQVYVIQTTATLTVTSEVTVKARSQQEAERKAAAKVKHIEGEPTVRSTVKAQWPAIEGMEITHDLDDGFQVRRGWFYQSTSYSYAGYYNRDRSLCFTPDQIETDGEIDRAKVQAFLDKGERLQTVNRVYGWACRHTSTPMWSKIHDEPKAALRSTRRFLHDTGQVIRDRQRHERDVLLREQLRLDDNKVAHKVHKDGGKLYRMTGGVWSTVIAEPEALTWFVRKDTIDRMVSAGLLEIKATMEHSGDAKLVEITPVGIERAEAQERVPEVLR